MKRYELDSIPQIAKWLWKYWKCYKYQAILNAAIGLLLVVSSLAFVWTTKLCIDIVTHKESVVSLQTAIIILISISFFQLLLGIGSKWIKATLGVRSQNGMRQAVFDKLILSEWNEVRQFHTGDLLNRIEQDVRDGDCISHRKHPLLVHHHIPIVRGILFPILDGKDIGMCHYPDCSFFCHLQ